MKHLLRGLAVLLILVLCLGVSAPVFADDPDPDPAPAPDPTPPPDTSVNIGVVTPGDVNVGIGIDAGGDVSVNVNGAPMASQQQLANVQQQLSNAINNATSGGAINTEDWWRYKRKYLDPLFGQLFGTNDLLSQAVAKLIYEKAITDNQTVQLFAVLNALDLRLADTSAKSEQEDKRIMDQIVYGAEAHITAQGQEITYLSNLIDLNQETTNRKIAQTTAQINAQIQALESNRITDFNNLIAYVQSVRTEYIFMFECVAGIVLVLLVGFGWLFWRVLKLRKPGL